MKEQITESGPKVFVSAGEVSGDQILSGILARLRDCFPDMDVRGLGGAASAAFGLKPLFPMERTAFSGAWDVLRNLGFAVRMYSRAAREMRRFRPDLAVLVDYPGLNLRLARLARNLGVPVCFVAPPQAWAYRRPARKLARAREALRGCAVHVLFPFEKALYAETAASISNGHFLDTIDAVDDREPMKAGVSMDAPEPGVTPEPPTIPVARTLFPTAGKLCLCPGSRLPVLRRNLPVWLDLLAEAGSTRSGAARETAVLVPAHLAGEANRILAAWSDARRVEHEGRDARERGDATGAQVGWTCAATVFQVRTDKAALLGECSAAIAFPGTLTLELALRRIPTLVLAILDPITLALGRRMLAGPRIALPNLLLGEDLFPEWAGTAPGPDAIRFHEMMNQRDDMNDWEGRIGRLRARMGPGGGAEAAFQACLALLSAQSARRPQAVR